MRIVTRDEMKAIDDATSRAFGIPSIVLMELAGKRVADEVHRLLRSATPRKHQRVAVVCGSGANGGDGFTCATHLVGTGVDVHIFLAARANNIEKDSLVQFEAAKRTGVRIVECDDGDVSPHIEWIRTCDVIVDALFGTGLKREIVGGHRKTIELLNGVRATRVAIDIPSGIDADRGIPLGVAIHADTTVTMGLPKRGLFLYPGADYAGDVVIADIGIPRALLEAETLKVSLLTEAEASAPVVRRARNTHKGTYGHVLVVAGSLGKTGAATLCANAAMRTGAGLVTIAAARAAQRIIETKTVETMCAMLTDAHSVAAAEQVFTQIVQLCEGKRVVAIGPGIPLGPGMAHVVRRVAHDIALPVVIDADALNLIAENTDVLKGARGPRVLTPHPGEMVRLTGKTTAEIANDRIGVAQAFAEEFNVHIILKGARSIVAAPDGRVWVNPTGNPGMATGGAGDVLCGMLSALIAQGIDPGIAARTATYLHGLAGDRVAARIGEWGMIASDLIDEVPRVLKDWEALPGRGD